MDDKVHEFYDMLTPVVKRAAEISENIYALYHAIEDDLSISDDEWKECREIYEAICLLSYNEAYKCTKGDCTCGNSV